MPVLSLSSSPSRLTAACGEVAPGLLLAGAVAGAAELLHLAPGLGRVSPMILAIVVGIVWRNTLGLPRIARIGVGFAQRRLLRGAIVLLGFQITLAQFAEVGLSGFVVLAGSLAATFAFTLWLGRRLAVRPELTELVAAGSSICGASAVAAAATVDRAEEADVAYAVAMVTLFGSLSMIFFPVLMPVFGLGAHDYGLWSGAAIHEIAQVVAATDQSGHAAAEIGMITKLGRVALLAPTVLVLARLVRRRDAAAGAAVRPAPFPWFVVGFVACVVVATVVPLPAVFSRDVALLTTFLLSVALAAMGLVTDLRHLAGEGLRPIALATAAWLFISGFALLLVRLLGTGTVG